MWKILSLVFVFGLFHPFANADCDDCALYESASKQISLYKELALNIGCGVLPVGLSIGAVGLDEIFVSKKQNPDGYLIFFQFKGGLEVNVCAFGTPFANIKGHGFLMITYQYYFATSEYVHIRDDYKAYGEIEVELLGSINLSLAAGFKHFIDATYILNDKIRPEIENSVSYFNADTCEPDDIPKCSYY